MQRCVSDQIRPTRKRVSRRRPGGGLRAAGEPPLPRRAATGPRAVGFPGQGDQAERGPSRRLEVAAPEGLQQDEDDQQRAREVENGGRLVFVAVIQAPGRGERVEAIVLNTPASVGGLPEGAGGELPLGKPGGPAPKRRLLAWATLSGDTPPRPPPQAVYRSTRSAASRRPSTSDASSRSSVVSLPSHRNGFGGVRHLPSPVCQIA
jgi:hypothetical protein